MPYLSLRDRLRRLFVRRNASRRSLLGPIRSRRPGYELLEDRSLLATVTWDGGAGTLNFADALNWDTNTIPGTADDAVIPDLVGTPTILLSSSRSLGSLTSMEGIQLQGAAGLTFSRSSELYAGLNLSGTGTLAVSGASSELRLHGNSIWGGGAIAGTGTTINLGQLDATSSAVRNLTGKLENRGILVRSANASFATNISGTLVNSSTGTIDISASGAAIAFSSSGQIQNFGTFRLTNSASSTVTVSCDFIDEGGAVEVVTSGSHLRFNGNPVQFSGTDFSIAAGGIVESASGNATWMNAITGSGGGQLRLNSTNAFVGVNFSVPAGMLWTTSTASFNGDRLLIPAGSDFRVELPSSNLLTLTTAIRVEGDLINSGIGPISTGSTGSVEITPTGSLRVMDGLAATTRTSLSGNGLVTNRGQILVESGAAISLGQNFHNLGGAIDVSSGTLNINAVNGVFDGGRLAAASGASLNISGNQTWKGTFTGGRVTKSGSMMIDSSGAAIDMADEFTYSAGTISGGDLTVAAGSTLSVTSTTSKIVMNHLKVYGTFNATAAANFAVDNPGVLHVMPGGLLNVGSILVGLLAGSTEGLIQNEGTIRTATTSAGITPPIDNTGTVEVLSGQSLSLGRPVVQQSGGTLTGGTWNVSGTLSFTSGSSAVTTIGPGASVTLNGGAAAFSKMEASQFQSNQGQLTIKGGKSFTTFRQFSNSGTLTVESGSSLTVPNTNPSPNYTQTAGSTVLVGGSITAPIMTMSSGALTGTGTITTNLTNSGGTVGPGASPGKITINGNYTQGAAGTISIEVAGTNAATPDFDQLIVTGVATLGGTLNVSAISDFLPSKGETFRFMTFTTRVGDFTTKNLAPYQGYALFGTNVGASFYDLNSLNIIVRNTNDSGANSFRQAILDANAASDADNILFHIPGAGPFAISPLSALPTITQPVTIDGYVQIGANQNTLAVGSNAVLKVELTGLNAGTGFVHGLRVQAPNTKIKGLAINGFAGYGVFLNGASANNVAIEGNYLGTDVTGTSAVVHPAVNNFVAAVWIQSGSHHNRIGANGDGVGDFGERNLISGNKWYGIVINGAGTDFNSVAGNYFGLQASGNSALPNGNTTTSSANVLIQNGAKSNRIGTDGSPDDYNESERNIISGGVNSHGVTILHAGTDFNVISGNYIGLNAAGTSPIGNAIFGVSIGGSGIFAGPQFNRIGSSADGVRDEEERNVISGNLSAGIWVYQSPKNIVVGNYIGTSADGLSPIGNAGSGIRIDDSADVIVGAPGAGNVIAASGFHGVEITGSLSTGVVVQGNRVGTDKEGTSALANSGRGISIQDSASNYIGGSSAGQGNLVSGNAFDGIYVAGSGASGNTIQGNRVGVRADGKAALGNVYSGITIGLGAHDNVVGGPNPGEGNLSSGNGGAGVLLHQVSANTVQANRLGIDIDGTYAIGNTLDGVLIENGAFGNLVGGQTAGARNIVSGNHRSGIAIENASTTANRVEGNYIGLNALGDAPITNDVGGVRILDGAANVIGGETDDARNVISGNAQFGINLTGAANSNRVLRNYIGTDLYGESSIANPIGVLIEGGASNNNVGEGSFKVPGGHGNLISGNGVAGVRISGTGTDSNHVNANLIGVNSSGLSSLPNATGIIVADRAYGNEVDQNLISGNSSEGVMVDSAGLHLAGPQQATSIFNNTIGLDISGGRDLGNAGSGVLIQGDSDFTVVSQNFISGNGIDGVHVDGTSNDTLLELNFIGLDDTGSLLFGNDQHGVEISSGAIDSIITGNTISGNSAGIRNDGASSRITSNQIGSSASGLKMLGNHRGSGASTEGHYGILSTGPGAQIGDIAEGNLIVGHDVGIWIKGANAGGIIQNNLIGVDVLEVAAMPNTIGMQLSDGASGLAITQNVIANSLSAGLRLLDTTSNNNSFSANRYFGNLGAAIDAGAPGATLNDDARTDGVLNFPVLDYADIIGGDLVLKGFVSAGRSVEFYVSTPTINGLGQGVTSFALFTEGSANDLDGSSASYGPSIRGVGVGSGTAQRFEFHIPVTSLPPALKYGSLITAVAVGSTSEFGNAITLGDPSSLMAPRITLPVGVNLAAGETLRVQGAFRDDDSTSWTLMVNYGDGSGPQPLTYAADLSFVLEHNYATSSTTPYQVTVTAIDNGNVVGIGVMGVSISNDPPQPTFNSFQFEPQVFEGQPFTLTGSFTDSGSGDSHTVTIDWGDGTAPSSLPLPLGARTFNAAHTYADDGESNSGHAYHRLIIMVEDNHSGFTTTPDGLYVVEVLNSLPTGLQISAPASVVENQLFALTGSFVDTGLDDSHVVSIDWGDGSPKEFATVDQLISDPATRAFLVLHKYADNPASPAASYNIRVEAVDDDEPLSPISATRTIIVANETPSLTVTPSTNVLEENGSLSLQIEVDDAGTLDSHQVVVDWGDGSEPKVVDLAAGETLITGLSHLYLNDPASGSQYTLQVKVRDKDMPAGQFEVDTRTITVANVAPTITELKWYSKNSAGVWTERAVGDPILEGEQIRITGKYSDPGSRDIHSAQVQWSSGKMTAASINQTTNSFEARFRYTDDYGINSAFDLETIQVTLSDNDGSVAIAETFAQVRNVSPLASFVPEVVTTAGLIPLRAIATDIGADPLTYSWNASNGVVTQSGAGVNFSVDLSLFGGSPIVVTLTVVDDDLGVATYRSALKLGTSAAETITVTTADFAAGVDTLLVLGLGGDDILDATSVPAPFKVILDGGDGVDYLYGGGGDDTYILRSGNDAANISAAFPPPVAGPALPSITPNYAGDDYYYLKPNSTLTVVDPTGANQLDFSLAVFGVAFNLATTAGPSLISQEVATGGHFVAATGQFTGLTGSTFDDTLVGASNATVSAGSGADKLSALAGTTNAKFIGGADADQFTAIGTGISGINFEGDEGADLFTVASGASLSGVIFSGGADADLFTVSSGGSIGGVSFEGDVGADEFVNAGSIGGVNFEGDEGADLFTNQGMILGAVTFSGGADADLFTNTGGMGSLGSISFEGDVGADQFVNSGFLGAVNFEGDDGADLFTNSGSISGVIFTGGADADLFTNSTAGSIGGVSFEGDEGADLFANSGNLLGAVIFTGGADADQFTNAGSLSALGSINFEGDEGADLFTNTGTLLGGVIFTGGADADVFTNATGGSIGAVNFEGDEGADLFSNQGTILGAVVFTGGADADQFMNSGGLGSLGAINFEGDEGADLFTNSGSLIGGVIFTGGADADQFINRSSGSIGGVSFEGDSGADLFVNQGAFIGGVIFTGGADADVFTNAGNISSLGSINFEGDEGADLFTNVGQILGSVIFTGGADADLFTNLQGGSISGVSFEGDEGADQFANFGAILGGVIFTGGADADLFVGNAGSSIGSVNFEGDIGADEFYNAGAVTGLSGIIFSGGADGDRLRNYASNVASITFYGHSIVSSSHSDDGADLFVNAGNSIGAIHFEGDSGADIFQNIGSGIDAISFEGDQGADVFVSLGSSISTISFEGDAGADVFGIEGAGIGAINFEGDDASEASNASYADTLVNRSTAASASSTITFHGYGGNDAFRNDGAGWKLVFVGGDDADAFQNNADGLSSINFEGDSGADVFENSGSLVSGVNFEGDSGADVFANGGVGVSGILFTGGADADLFVNSGSNLSGVNFEGDTGADTFANLGNSLTGVNFEGDDGNDRVFNSGAALYDLVFTGGAGADRFLNQITGVRASEIHFFSGAGDDGADLFVNLASTVSNLIFTGGADADVFQNFGANLSGVNFEGDQGADQFQNWGAGLSAIEFHGGADADLFENRGDSVGGVSFFGDEGADTFLERGNFAIDLTFHGGDDADILVNYGQSIGSISFEGDAGDDRLQNNGDAIDSIVFLGGTDADAFQNNGDFVSSISFEGDSGADTFLNYGSNLGAISFEGDQGADAFINTGSEIASIIFTGGADADLFRAQGSGLGEVSFEGDEGDDAMLYSASGTAQSTVTFLAGAGEDVLAFSGQTDSLIFSGGLGADRVMYSGIVTTGNWNVPTATDPEAAYGDDRFEFVVAPQGAVTIGEAFGDATDISRDTLDFSAFTAGNVVLDLASTNWQSLPGDLSIRLLSVMGIEIAIGSKGGDTIYGNERDNYLGGAEYYYTTGSQTPAASSSQTQWVYLNFDSYTEAQAGEHVYTQTERNSIQSRIEATYSALSQLYNLRFTQTAPTEASYVTINFNRTPETGRAGGESSEIDFGNLSFNGEARVQVNGLLGGLELPSSPTADFMETLPEDTAAQVGADKPAGTSDNLIALSAKIASHELGHLLGLRHYDSFGPIGFGIHSPPGNDEFKPAYQGPSAAFETFDHIIGSPASIGSTRANDVGQLFFGERESLKLAFALSDSTQTTVDEQVAPHNAVNSAQSLNWAVIATPNMLAQGLNHQKTFYVDALAVKGQITLDASGHSESDYYKIYGKANDLVTIEVMSKALRRYSNLGIDGYIDSVVRLRNAQGQIVGYFNATAENDDEFESSDSLLMDVALPSDGDYFIEVDTFYRPSNSSDPVYLAAVARRQELETLSNRTPAEEEQLKQLADSLDDTDVGGYELFVYRFNKASSIDGNDLLVGRGGVDIIDAGVGDNTSSLAFDGLPSSAAAGETQTYSALIPFHDPSGNTWTVVIDYGDGEVATRDNVTPASGIAFSHAYADDGVYVAKISIGNDDGAAITGQFSIVVTNSAPTAVITSISAVRVEGSVITVDGSGSDVAGSRDTLTYRYEIWTNGNLVSNASDVNLTSYSFTPADNSDYEIRLIVSDEDGGATTTSEIIAVANLAPTATISSAVTIDEGSSTNVDLQSAADASSIDLASLRYYFSISQLARDTASYSTSSATASQSFAFDDNGLYTVYSRVIDKDGDYSDYETTVVVNNVVPTAILVTPATINEGASTTVNFTGGSDVSSVDATSLRYFFSTSLASRDSAIYSTSSASETSQSFAFNDNGSYTVYGRVIDKDGGFTDYETTITVNNVAPTATWVAPASIDEGGLTTLNFTNGSDASSVDSTSLRYFFSTSQTIRDAATYSTSAVSATSQSFSFDDNGSYAVYGRVIDKDGGFTDYQTTIVVNNVAPTAALDNSGPISEGGAVTVSFTGRADASSVDASSLHYFFSTTLAARDAATYSASPSSASQSYIFNDDGSYTVYGRVLDKDGGFTDYETTIRVNNLAPTASISNTGPVNEGGSVSVSLTDGADASSIDAISLRYFFALTSAGRDVATYADSSASPSQSFTFNDDGSYTIYGRVIDKDGAYTDYETIVVVNNVAPTATFGGPATQLEGSTAAFSFTSAVDASSLDASSLHFAFAIDPSPIADSYLAANAPSSANILFTDNGTYTVRGRIYDKDNGFTEYVAMIVVQNVAPTATLPTNVSISAGGSASVTFTGQSDPSTADTAATFHYSFATSPAGLTADYTLASPSASSPAFVFAASGVIYGRIIDKDGGRTDYSTVVSVTGTTTNVPPTVAISGVPNDMVRGVNSIFTFTATDADAADQATGQFVFTITWGDGTTSTATSAAGANYVNVAKTYNSVSANDGVFTISATARDARGALGPSASREVGVLGWATMADPLHAGNAILVIVGSQGDDIIKLKDVDCDNLRITIREREEHLRFRGTVDGDVDRIMIYGLAGNDKITLDDDITIEANIWGGAGDDKIKGGSGADVILGESGDDKLYGGDGRDMLIGGAGADSIHGDDNDDILIAGYTIYDKHRLALEAILAEWNSTRTYAQRRANIMGVGTGARANSSYYFTFDGSTAASNTVSDDGVRDTLWGDDGRDWFMYQFDGDHSTAKDQVKDKQSNENGDDIDKWW